MSERLPYLVHLLRALEDATRLRILKCLQVRPACVCELVQALELPQSRISRHLRVLREAGLVVDARNAQWIEYALVEPRRPAEAHLLAVTLGELGADDQVSRDLDRLETASREACVPE
jgi:ArsR family transcriptional regulator